MDESCVSIKILKKVPFRGEGDSLENRLRNVTLRGFPDIKIYEKSLINEKRFSPQEVMRELHTPQPFIYQDKFDRISSLRRLFQDKGIDILQLDAAYDFEAINKEGVKSYWTMIPPVVEKFMVPLKSEGNRFDYGAIIGDEVSKVLEAGGLGVNKELDHLEVKSDNNLGPDNYRVINDGLHRVHLGVKSGEGVSVLEIEDMSPGFPYYAAPQHYSSIIVIPTRDKRENKVHVVDAPVHKHLYRLFPSGGIMSGDVRPLKIHLKE